MSSIVVTIKTARADVATIVGAGGKETVQRVVNLLDGGLVGASDMRVDAQYSTSNPVAASGTFTLASAVATDAVTVGTVTLTASSTPANENQWEIDGADDAADATALAAAINAHSTLSKVVSAAAVDAVVTVTCKVKGAIGNQIAISSADATITASGSFLSGGTGGAESDVATAALGLA